MKVQAETLINRFIRTHSVAFSSKDFMRALAKMGVRASRRECEEYLATHSCIFAVSNGLYITRSGAFTKQFFSFKPTRFEVEQNVFAAGGRCMPFVDPEMLPSELTFLYNGKMLAQQTAEFDNGTAGDLFALYGSEFASQYIAADPSNAAIDLVAQDFELPAKVNLTCNTLQPLVKYGGFKYGDRILCRVVNWDLGHIEVMPVKRNEKYMRVQVDDLERQNWYALLEELLLASFETIGPCASIEEQLAHVFLDNSETLCTSGCGSVEEFLAQSRRVAYEPFGVETRLWRAGEEAPAVGKWNELSEEDALVAAEERILDNLAVPDYILDAYIEDQLFNKKYEPEKIIAQILPENVHLTVAEKRFFLLHVNGRHDIIRKAYNWFADFSVGPLRHRALALYKTVSLLVFEIDSSVVDLELYPQQELVILSQIFSHVLRILEMIEMEPSAAIEDMDEIKLSLEGMESNFEEIRGALVKVIEDEKRKGFVVIK
ncbi:MAG: hypothetical protein IJR50_06885 [Treponema sp.]|nr:hypothetical protein [Treponema sp.]